MALDPKDLFDPVEGEPLRDVLGYLQNANIRQGQQQAQAEARRLASLPSCPYCGGKIDGQYELCRHCRSSLSYVEGVPCKPGQERELKSLLRRQRQEEIIRSSKEKEENIVRGYWASWFFLILGFVFLLGIPYSLQNPDKINGDPETLRLLVGIPGLTFVLMGLLGIKFWGQHPLKGR